MTGNPQDDAHAAGEVARADPSEIGRALARLRWDAARAELEQIAEEATDE